MMIMEEIKYIVVSMKVRLCSVVSKWGGGVYKVWLCRRGGLVGVHVYGALCVRSKEGEESVFLTLMTKIWECFSD